MRTIYTIVAHLAAAILLLTSSACSTAPINDLDDAVVEDTGSSDDGIDDPGESPSSEDPPDDSGSDDPSDDSGSDDPPDDPPSPPECGANSYDNGLGSCVCEANYDWCDPLDASIGCCAWGADTFEVTVVSATVLPYANPDTETPWDWSGSVPGWMQDIIGVVVSYVDEDAEDWLDILDYVYQFAPELLQGTVPPDPFVEIELDGDVVDETAAQQDVLEPYWDETTTVTLGAGSELTLWYLDEDLAFDDTIEGVLFTREDLQWLAGIGDVTFEGSYRAYEFTVAVEPVH